jgi:Cupin-like domain
MRHVPEWQSTAPEQFQAEILPTGEPAVLRGIARDWPLVRAGNRCAEMLAANANDVAVEILRADPGEQGRFHYSADGRSLNFIRGRARLPVFLAALREEASIEPPHALVAQGLRADRHVPGFAASHPMPFVPESAEPRLWIGNAAKTATHNDPVDNLAVVVAGRRRFTIFPPGAREFLYMGPDHPTPAGTPVSMVHVSAPDFELFPLFESALDSAQEAELSAGDAVFIPRDWYHHVEALESFNLLVNYWWDARTGND